MSQLYPAQNSIWKQIKTHFQVNYLDVERDKLKETGTQILVLEKNGVRYSALSFQHADNGKWILQATGNGQPIERVVLECAKAYQKIGYNLLMVNGPGVGRSEGSATPNTIGEAQELGLQHLENLGAKKIVLAGFSLGGAAIGQTILHHNFQDRQYFVVRQLTFDRVSNIFRKYAKVVFPPLKPFSKSLVRWANCEIDSVAASRKLQTLSIPEAIIQAGTGLTFDNDGVIPARATLGYRLVKEGVTDLKYFYTIPGSGHKLPFEETLAAIQAWE